MDNPRTEAPDQILQDMTKGLRAPQAQTVYIEPDRAQAIGLGLSLARGGDVVLIAGKGHETYQILGRERIHFSDRDVARACLKRTIHL
jgi:UDP-N-acetylmuramoyl-L-alanyl-D-glutamate--2,6-diaminopimelate ligase